MLFVRSPLFPELLELCSDSHYLCLYLEVFLYAF
jgi:hypothetical protein